MPEGGVFYSLDPSRHRLSGVVGRLLIPQLMKKYQTEDEREWSPWRLLVCPECGLGSAGIDVRLRIVAGGRTFSRMGGGDTAWRARWTTGCCEWAHSPGWGVISRSWPGCERNTGHGFTRINTDKTGPCLIRVNLCPSVAFLLWKARDTRLERFVALKLLPAERTTGWQRFDVGGEFQVTPDYHQRGEKPVVARFASNGQAGRPVLLAVQEALG
jgi:hypothetical protein